MTMYRFTAIIGACALALAAVGAAPAAAQDQQVTPTIVVSKDKSAAFRLEYPASEIVVAQPEIAALVATTDRSFYIRGKLTGVTNLLVYDKQHRLAQVIDVRVGADVDSIQQDINTALPGENIKVTNFANGVLLSGDATNSLASQRALSIAERYAPKQVSSELNIKNADQVMVEVRVMEATRTALKDLGFNISAESAGGGFSLNTGSGLLSNQAPAGTIAVGGTIGDVRIDAAIQALEQKGVIRTLAKPNLIAMSGEEASFLAGGEFPYPIPSGPQQVAIEFKPFGVKLNFKPEVQNNGTIRMRVSPEVSQLDPRQHLRIAGFDLPALTVRKASTSVELQSGQSFAIAGLLQQDYVNAVSQVPWAGDIPILGALFRSSSWKRQETELIIIVTPRLTSPANTLDSLPNPLRNGDEPTAIDLILMGIAARQPMNQPITGTN
jgi:pilus assembly protein CpaC